MTLRTWALDHMPTLEEINFSQGLLQALKLMKGCSLHSCAHTERKILALVENFLTPARKALGKLESC